MQDTPGLLTQAAALLAGINTDEYLYLNFTANAQRRTLLYALDARSPGYAIEMSMGELSKEPLSISNPPKPPFGPQKASFHINLRLNAPKDCSLWPQTPSVTCRVNRFQGHIWAI